MCVYDVDKSWTLRNHFRAQGYDMFVTLCAHHEQAPAVALLCIHCARSGPGLRAAER